MDKILIGNQIRKYRREKGLTQAQLAEIANMSEKTLSDIENCKINPRYKSIINIARRHISRRRDTVRLYKTLSGLRIVILGNSWYNI